MKEWFFTSVLTTNGSLLISHVLSFVVGLAIFISVMKLITWRDELEHWHAQQMRDEPEDEQLSLKLEDAARTVS